ncbi:MAG: transposase family protein, partial [Pirellulales bacterium]|nr:transposase family protein [Pirellulales bacterium]
MVALDGRDGVNLVGFFDDLPDPRSSVNRLHRLGDVIVIAICAVVAQADGPTMLNWGCRNCRMSNTLARRYIHSDNHPCAIVSYQRIRACPP